MNTTQLHDVFMMHAPLDTGLARLVREKFANAGMSVYAIANMFRDDTKFKEIRAEMIACPAILLLLTPSNLKTEDVAYFAGASGIWHNALFCLYDGIEKNDIPTILNGFESYHLEDIDQVIQCTGGIRGSFSVQQQDALARLFQEKRKPVEDVLLATEELDHLTDEYNISTKSDLTTNRIAQELMRIHKAGRLFTANGASNTHKTDGKT